jgi:hypothetical protein
MIKKQSRIVDSGETLLKMLFKLFFFSCRFKTILTSNVNSFFYITFKSIITFKMLILTFLFYSLLMYVHLACLQNIINLRGAGKMGCHCYHALNWF